MEAIGVKVNSGDKTVTIINLDSSDGLRVMELALRAPHIKKTTIARIIAEAIESGADGDAIHKIYDELDSYEIKIKNA